MLILFIDNLISFSEKAEGQIKSLFLEFVF